MKLFNTELLTSFLTLANSVLNSSQSCLLLKLGQVEPYHFQDLSIHQPIKKSLLNTKIQSFKAYSVTDPSPKSLKPQTTINFNLNILIVKSLPGNISK